MVLLIDAYSSDPKDQSNTPESCTKAAKLHEGAILLSRVPFVVAHALNGVCPHQLHSV